MRIFSKIKKKLEDEEGKSERIQLPEACHYL